ncbi:MAG: hypothetical protein RL308_1000, partial [Bacteroidota bacterium]
MVKINSVKLLKLIKISFFVFWMTTNSALVAQVLPNDLPNLKLWLRSDSLVLNGNKVVQWTDLSGNNNHISQADVSKQPSFIANQINGYPIVSFDGINDNLKNIFSQTYNTEVTIFIVMRNNSSSPVFIYDGGTNYLSMIYVNNNLYIQSGNPNIFYSKIAPFPFSFFQSEYTGTTSKIFENSLLKLTGTLPSPIMNGFTLGTRYQQDVYFYHGDVAEIFVYNSVLSASDKSQIELYLRDKYVQDFSLGADIISNDFCPINITAPNGFTNLLWSTGATTPTIAAAQSGQYWVQGTDIFGFVSRDTIQVGYPQISLPTVTNICLNDTITWDPQLGSAYTYLWSNGATTPSLAISAAGTYSV